MDRFVTICVDEQTRSQLKKHKETKTYDELMLEMLDVYEDQKDNLEGDG